MVLTACPSVGAECTLRLVFLRNTISAALMVGAGVGVLTILLLTFSSEKKKELLIQISNFSQIMDREKGVLRTHKSVLIKLFRTNS